jgi:hypothetical protein
LEKAARRLFFVANGKTPEDEALDSAKATGKAMLVIGCIVGLFCLLG